MIERQDVLTPLVETQALQAVQSTGLNATKTEAIFNQFKEFFDVAKSWEEKAPMLKVTDESQTAEMGMARTARLALKEKRILIEKRRKELKEDALREGKAIDGIANILKNVIVPLEKYFEEQETFAERRVAERKERLKQERLVLLFQYDIDTAFYDLANMPEESFLQLLKSCERALEERIAAEKKAEEERLQKEAEELAEKQRIKEENMRLKEEAKKKAEDAKKKAEEEKKKRAEAEKLLKAKEDALRKAEEEKVAALESLRVKEEAERKEKARQEAEAKKLAEAPDKEKLSLYCDALLAVPTPSLTTAKYQDLFVEGYGNLETLVRNIKAQL